MTYFELLGNAALTILVVLLAGTTLVWFWWCYKMMKDLFK